jgi:DNA-binding NarL/FixJ family response regulator
LNDDETQTNGRSTGMSATVGQLREAHWRVKVSRKTTDVEMRGKLSAREKDVARHLVRGVSNKEIARALGIEVVTVKKHVGNILRKLGVENRTQAAMRLSAMMTGMMTGAVVAAITVATAMGMVADVVVLPMVA